MVNIFAKMGIFLPGPLIFKVLGMGIEIPMDGDFGERWGSGEAARERSARRTEKRGRLFMERNRGQSDEPHRIAGRSLGLMSNET